MVSQCLTSAALFGASDVVAQQIVEKRGVREHDVSCSRALVLSRSCYNSAVILISSTVRCVRRSMEVRDYVDQSLLCF